MPFRKKSRNPLSSLSSRRASSPEKENSAAAMPHHRQPLSPRLARCHSDNTQRTFCELSSTRNKLHNGVLSAEEKLSNLMQLNSSLVKEVSTLRVSQRDLTEKVHHQEELLLKGQSLLQENHGFQEENSRFLLEIASLKEDLCMYESENARERSELIAKNIELQSSLTASCCREKEQSDNLETLRRDTGLLVEEEKNAKASVEAELRAELLAKENLNLQIKELMECLACCRKEAGVLEFEKTNLLVEKQAMQAHMGEIVKKMEVESKLAYEAKEQTEKKMRRQIESLENLLEDYKVSGGVEKEEAKRLHSLQISQLTESNDSLLAEKEIKIAEIADLRDNIIRLSDRCDALNKTVKEKSALLLEEQRSGSAARECLLSMEEKIEKLRILNLKLAQEVASTRGENEQLEAQTRTLLSDRECLLVQKEGLEGTVSSLIQKHEKLEGSFSSLTGKHVELNQQFCSEADRFQEIISSLQTEKEEALERINTLLAERTHLEGSLCILSSTHKELTEALNVMEMKVAANEKTISSLLAEKNELDRSLKKELTQGLEAIKETDRIMSLLKSDKEKLHLDNKKLREQIARLQEEGNRLSLDKSVLLSEKMKMVTEKEELVGTLSTISSNNQELIEIQESNQKALSSISSEFDQLQEENERLSNENSFLKEDTSRLSTEKITLLAEKQVMLTEKIELEGALCGLRERCREVDEQRQAEIMVEAAAQNDLVREIEHLKMVNAKLTDDNISLSSSTNACEDEIKGLLSKQVKVEADFASLQQAFRDMESDIEKKSASFENEKEANALLESILEAKNEALAKSEEKLEKTYEQVANLHSRVGTLGDEFEAKIKVKEDLVSENHAALVAEKEANASLKGEVSTLENKLNDAYHQVAVLKAQYQAKDEIESDLRVAIEAMKNDAQDSVENEAKKIIALDTELKSVLQQSREASEKVRMLETELVAKHNTQVEMESLASITQNELLKASRQVSVHKRECEEPLLKVHALEMELKTVTEKERQSEEALEMELKTRTEKEMQCAEAFLCVKALEMELEAMAKKEKQLDSQVRSMAGELASVRNVALQAEEVKATYEGMLDAACVKNKALENQLQTIKTSMQEVQSNAAKGSASKNSRHLSGTVEEGKEGSPLEKEPAPSSAKGYPVVGKKRANRFKHRRAKASGGSTDQTDEHATRSLEETQKTRQFLAEKSKMVRLALPVVLISASALLYEGIQSYYLRGFEN